MPEGWDKAFGKELLKELREAMLKDGGRKYIYNVRIMRIKEKWGALRIYLNFYGEETAKVIDRYEELSSTTCIDCGKPAVGCTTSWICPFCEDCKDALDHSGHTDDWFEYFKQQPEKTQNQGK